MDLLQEFSEDELKLTDVKLLRWYNIFPLSWDWSRGAKTVRYYNVGGVPGEANQRCKIEWTYEMDAGNRSIVRPERKITYLETDGVTPIIEQDISKPYNIKELGQLNMDIRIGRITDLRQNAEQLPGDPDNGIPPGSQIVEWLYEWYGPEIFEYEDRGNLGFENALKTENDPVRLAVLNAPIAAYGGLSVMNLLAFQLIGAFTWT